MQITFTSRKYDVVILLAAIALAVGGLFHLWTITNPGETYYLFRQIIWVGVGISVMFFFSYLKISFWQKGAYFFYVIILFFLLLVLFKEEGVYGAQRWFRIRIIGFQPSEFAKLILIIIWAKLLAGKEKINKKQITLSFCFTLIFLILVALQPDLGSALILVPLWLATLFLAGISLKGILTILGIGSLSLPFSYFFLHPYQKARILTFLNPGRDPLGTGWNILQSKITLGSGRLIGKGLGGAVHTQLSFLPRPFTDFVLATIGEEWGFMGILILLGLYFIIIFRGIRIVQQESDNFAKLLGVGIVILLFLQVFINVGMVVGIMPVTGIPLPLVSYGGSSTIMFFSGIGILLGISRLRNIQI